MIEHDGTIHFGIFLISHINFSVGWPLGYDDSHYDISPIPFDCDNDGIDDLLLINYDGLIRCVKACDYDILSFLDRHSESLHLRIRSEHPPLSSRLPTVLSSFLSTIHRNDLLKTKHPYVYSNTIFFDNDQFVYLNTTERSFCQPLQIVYSLSFSLTL